MTRRRLEWCIVVFQFPLGSRVELPTTPRQALRILAGDTPYPTARVLVQDLNGNRLSLDQLRAMA